MDGDSKVKLFEVKDVIESDVSIIIYMKIVLE